MADIDFDVLYDYVLPYLPGAEKGIVDFHIRRVLREFFKRTTIWRLQFQFVTTPGTSDYQLVPGAANQQVSSILSVDVDTKEVPVVPEDRRDRNATPGKPTGWYNTLPQLLTLYPTPDAAYTIRVNAALTLPIDTAERSVPANVINEYAEKLAAGVISGMMLMPGKPWTKLDVGASYGRIYGACLRETRGQIRDGGQPSASTFIAARKFGV